MPHTVILFKVKLKGGILGSFLFALYFHLSCSVLNGLRSREYWAQSKSVNEIHGRRGVFSS
jgi:hypothetical protein